MRRVLLRRRGLLASPPPSLERLGYAMQELQTAPLLAQRGVRYSYRSASAIDTLAAWRAGMNVISSDATNANVENTAICSQGIT